MKLKNNSTRTYIAGEYRIEAGEIKEIKDEKMAKILLKQEGIEETITKEDVKKVEEENEKLKQELELAKLKEEATELGIKFPKNIGIDTLTKKIEEFKMKN